jgi:hypothetical protein
VNRRRADTTMVIKDKGQEEFAFGILNHCYSKFRAKLIFETNNYTTLHSKILIKLNTINYSTLHFTQIKVKEHRQSSFKIQYENHRN